MISGLLRVASTNTAVSLLDKVGNMPEQRLLLVAPISAEILVATDLNDVHHWLVECQSNPVRLDAEHLPALGRHSWLRVGPPIRGPRAVLCRLWLVEAVDRAGCLVAGHLRFVAHPTTSDVKVAFDGCTGAAPRTEATGKSGNAARQLLVQIAAANERPRSVARVEIAS
jgi:hypothetical protein